MDERHTFTLAWIGVIGIASQWLAWRFKLPAILFLLVAGLAIGPLTGLIEPDALFGHLLFPIVSLGVALVLFEGSLTLRFHEIKGLENVVRNLVTLGVVVTWVITAVAARWLIDLSWEVAFLFGALMVVTGPTVITPLLRTARPVSHLAHILRWEGIIIDPLGASLVVLVYEFIVSGQGDQNAGWVFIAILLVGGLGGVAGAYALARLLRRALMPDYLHDVVTVALVLGLFTLANSIQPESGLLAVTVMGIALANWKGVDMQGILDFKESLSILIISGLFIILSARLDPKAFEALGWPALGVLAVILFVARPASVWLSAIGSSLHWREKLLLGWIAPRGIIAAAVSALFALALERAGHGPVVQLVPLTFFVIIGTVLLQSITARPLARLLDVAEPEPRGVLIVGANPLARAIAQELQEQGLRAQLASTNWDDVSAARLEGLDVYFGNVVSEHADRHLDLVGIGRLLGLSRRAELNALAGMRYRNEFGSNSIFTLQTSEEQQSAGQRVMASRFTGQRLFGAEINYDKLSGLLAHGGEIHSTSLTQKFGYEDFKERYQQQAIPLFALDERDCLQVFTSDHELQPGAGWQLISLLPAEVIEETNTGKVAKRNRKLERVRKK
jgi:NhaP-type Na+/H+ or K+/H+ antiporter